MVMLKRISLFLLTNILVLVTVSFAFNLIMYFMGADASAYGNLPILLLFCTLWGFGGAFISLLLSKKMARWMMKVKIIDPKVTDPQLRALVQLVHELARKAKLPKMPEVGVYDSPEVNAFATGPSKSNSLVAVSSGLMHRMSREEVEGVLGHEVAHIANGDMVTMTLIQGVVNAFVMFFARILANVLSSTIDEKFRTIAYFGLVILFDIIFAILGSLVVNYFSQRREFRADLGGAKFAGKDKMVAALRRLQNTADLVDTSQEAVATLKITHKSGGLAALMSTHPPLEERIRRLERATSF